MNNANVPIMPLDTLLVSFDFTHGDDNKILLVGKKTGKTVTIVNAFEGEKAFDIYKTLTETESKEE